jgi:hypothetical protein
MKISKWVDMGQEVEIEIGMDDIRAAMAECFGKVTEERLFDAPGANEVIAAFSTIGKFFNALTAEHINLLTTNQKRIVANYLADQVERFKETEVVAGKTPEGRT